MAAATASGIKGIPGSRFWERVDELVSGTGGGGGKADKTASAAPGRDLTRLRQLIVALKAGKKPY